MCDLCLLNIFLFYNYYIPHIFRISHNSYISHIFRSFYSLNSSHNQYNYDNSHNISIAYCYCNTLKKTNLHSYHILCILYTYSSHNIHSNLYLISLFLPFLLYATYYDYICFHLYQCSSHHPLSKIFFLHCYPSFFLQRFFTKYDGNMCIHIVVISQSRPLSLYVQRSFYLCRLFPLHSHILLPALLSFPHKAHIHPSSHQALLAGSRLYIRFL